MREIDGVKYISKEDFNKGMMECVDKFSAKLIEENRDPMMSMMTTMIVMGEMCRLEGYLFDEEEKTDEGTEKTD